MSSLLESVDVNNEVTKCSEKTSSILHECTNNNTYLRHILKPKNIFKSKCSKAQKNKFKKYKLRKDGKEDQDIIDVSQTLLSTLKIKSPNNRTLLKSPDILELKPKNYLFKMARRKQKSKSDGPAENSKNHKVSGVCTSPINENQERKHTNAFKLMMDSRNKIIGSNSPGKDKVSDPLEMQETIEKKKLKVKRNLALVKMAEAKGALKKKELEEYEDKCIERKMNARANRLKSMITKKKQEKAKNLEQKREYRGTNKPEKEKHETVAVDGVETINDKTSVKKSKDLQLIDIFSDREKHPSNSNSDEKPISKEDAEFLKNLSPSIKKKENMLCYFKKIEKKSDSCADVEHDIDDNNSTDVIKVKTTPKMKKKTKGNKLCRNKNASNDVLKDHNENNSCSENVTLEHTSEDIGCATSTNESRKRKRKENALKLNCEETKARNPIDISDGRPKRHVKKPVKYIDDVQLSSSDEELHIFTPKKRKQVENKTKPNMKKSCDNIVNISDEESYSTKSSHKKNSEQDFKPQKKPSKLAPIFAPKPSPEELEAKQKFLHSGIPDQLKKLIAQQRKENTEFCNIFPTVVHVQQKTATVEASCPLLDQTLFNSPDDYFDYENIIPGENSFRQLLTLTKLTNTAKRNSFMFNKNNTQVVLQNIKEVYPKFPVYRTYRTLKGKSKGEVKDISPAFDNSIEVINGFAGNDLVKENLDTLTWTDKYKATSTSHLIGNFESIKEVRKWLISWTENEIRPKNGSITNSDSSDFYDSETDSIKTTNNLLILSGPAGSGKTSSVYAVAAELAIKVIEVNASSKRTGKVMLQDLQEATQSHKVNRGTGSTENSQRSQDVMDGVLPNTIKKRGRPKNPSKKSVVAEKNEMLSQLSAGQEVLRTGISLILIDDADIVFDQDDGFSSAIAQLIHCSKRPVILVTSSLSCPHLQRFLHCGRIVNMRPLSPKMLGTWLDIMCLADNGTCWPGLGSRLLDLFRGDIRKTINCLQFYVTTQTQSGTVEEETASQNSDYYKINIQDENSSISWAEQEGTEEKNSISQISVNFEDETWKYFLGEQSNLVLSYPLDLFNMWWSIPRLLNETYNNPPECALLSKSSENKEKRVNDLETVANVYDTFSVADYLTNKKSDNRMHITSQPWRSFESDSVSELDCLDTFCKSDEISDEICHKLVTTSVVNAQRTLRIGNKTDIYYPEMTVQRERDLVLARHDYLTDILNPSAILDRKALALDYWSSCRTICKIEKNKTDTSSKRNNRFYHYLKSLNVLCKNDSFDKLGDSLSYGGKEDC